MKNLSSQDEEYISILKEKALDKIRYDEDTAGAILPAPTASISISYVLPSNLILYLLIMIHLPTDICDN